MRCTPRMRALFCIAEGILAISFRALLSVWFVAHARLRVMERDVFEIAKKGSCSPSSAPPFSFSRSSPCDLDGDDRVGENSF